MKNTNDVPVMMRLISLSTRRIHFPEGDRVILQPGTTITRLVEYRSGGAGKFNGYLEYVINDSHFFDLGVTADVVHKQLHVDEREIVLGKEWSSEEAYRPMASTIRITNKLSAKTYFR